MKRPISHFEELENLVSFSYSNFGNSLQVYEKEYSKDSSLGYCYRYKNNGITIYNVIHSKIGKDHTDRRIVAHEYGHIVLGHLNGIHEELDGRIIWTINNSRADLIKGINESLGIDYADKLLNRVIDDPQLNHSLHNIAMDFEVNQQILSSEDIEEMENDITEATIKNSSIPELTESLDKSLDDPNLSEEEKEKIKKAKDSLSRQIASSKIKLMLPERYHLPDGTPFPKDLTYPEYLILIIKNLDQFVKMLISIKNGGSGDTSEVTDEELKDALNSGSQDQGQGDGDPQNGNGGGMQSLDDLMDACGMGDNSGNSGNKYEGCRDEPEKSQNGKKFDHSSESRDDADQKREKGQLKSNTPGCGKTGGSDNTLDLNEGPKDPVELAIDEVIKNFKAKVCSFELKKDMTYLYNRGINREVIAPIYHTKVKITQNPKIVFLIDVSGSMDTNLVKRILHSISRKMSTIKKGLKYDVIAWNTHLSEHFRDIDPRKPIPKIRVGGGTTMAKGIKFFKENYGKESVLVLISDFEDYLDEWERETTEMREYDLYGFNYGYYPCDRTIKNFKIRNFQNKK